MKLTDEQIEEIYQSFDCLIPKSLIKKILKKILKEIKIWVQLILKY